jgi:hypothetical protein
MPTSLTPVLELRASTFSTRDRPLPAGSRRENPTEWHDRCVASLADSGLVGLAAFPIGSQFCPLDQLTPEFVRIILQKELADVTEWNLDEVGPLSGGYVLTHGDALIAPGCCGDLSNLHDWSEAANSSSDDWQMVWIGHPWTHVRASGETLVFASPSDEASSPPPQELVRIDREDFRRALADASRRRETFAKVVRAALEPICPRDIAPDVTRILVFGRSIEHASGA